MCTREHFLDTYETQICVERDAGLYVLSSLSTPLLLPVAGLNTVLVFF